MSESKVDSSKQQQTNNTNDIYEDTIRGLIFGAFIGDSLAMPVHWYYNLKQLKSDFPKGITKYESPKYPFPGSIMNLSNTGDGGRGNDKGNIIGDIINHGKKKYWLKSGSYHYHHTLNKGENTLDSEIVKHVLLPYLMNIYINENKNNKIIKFEKEKYLIKYIKFMTTPNTHNDTYASTTHRMFFKNWSNKKELFNCGDNDGHNTDAIDALTFIPSLIAMGNVYGNEIGVVKNNVGLLTKSMRKPNKATMIAVNNYVGLLWSVLMYKKSLNNITNIDVNMLGKYIINASKDINAYKYVTNLRKYNENDPMVACYIDSSYPAFLGYSYKYYDKGFNYAIFKSVNGGGENVGRSTIMGALFGAFYGYQSISNELKIGLKDSKLINDYVDKIFENLKKHKL